MIGHPAPQNRLVAFDAGPRASGLANGGKLIRRLAPRAAKAGFDRGFAGGLRRRIDRPTVGFGLRQVEVELLFEQQRNLGDHVDSREKVEHLLVLPLGEGKLHEQVSASREIITAAQQPVGHQAGSRIDLMRHIVLAKAIERLLQIINGAAPSLLAELMIASSASATGLSGYSSSM